MRKHALLRAQVALHVRIVEGRAGHRDPRGDEQVLVGHELVVEHHVELRDDIELDQVAESRDARNPRAAVLPSAGSAEGGRWMSEGASACGMSASVTGCACAATAGGCAACAAWRSPVRTGVAASAASPFVVRASAAASSPAQLSARQSSPPWFARWRCLARAPRPSPGRGSGAPWVRFDPARRSWQSP
jgi:hypothetical protein